jgi:serine/threonine-protein kinase
MSDFDRRIGTTLEGKYRIETLLGEGGLGKVYRAAHTTLGGEVAVKFLTNSAAGREGRERFRREARALARLRHPAIVAAIDFGDADGELFLVMELVAGPRLADCILVDGAPMPFRRIAGITRQILEVLEATHAAGIVHRDLKPENVMLADVGDRADHVKVLDFGIALVVEEPDAPRLTATQAVQGTPLYMSPEQCKGRDVGPPSDVYSLGAVLYEMLSGEPPFDAPTGVELMAQHLYVAPSPVAERGVGRTVPPDLEELALRALGKRPEERPTARAMLDAIDGYLSGTSPAVAAQRATEERVRAVGLSRSQRGLPAGAHEGSELAAALAITAVAGKHEGAARGEDEAFVDAWGLGEERVEALRSALAVRHVTLRRWKDDATPPPAHGKRGDVVRAVLVPADDRAADRVKALRARADAGTVPVLAIDAQPERIAALVRAGASDVTLAIVGDDVLCEKLRRLIRRGR